MLALSNATTFRRRLTGVTLVLGSAALVVSTALKDMNSNDAGDMLRTAAAHPDRLVASTAAQLVASILLVPATIGVLHMIRGRGTALAHVGIGLMILNLLGNVADVTHSALLGVLATGGVTPAEISIVDRLSSNALESTVELMTLVGLLGFPIVAAALWRSGAVPRAIPALIVVGAVSFFFPIPEVIGSVVMAAAFSWLGVDILGETDALWERGWRDEPAAVADGRVVTA
ncbi:MAG TPA: DUF4386 family protein [Gaiellaceae bacterium]